MYRKRTWFRGLWLILLLSLLLSGCAQLAVAPKASPTATGLGGEPAVTPMPELNVTDELVVSSPGSVVEASLLLADGKPYYAIRRGEQDVVVPSRLGFVFKEAAPLNQDFVIADHEETSFDETWTQPWGEVKEIRNHYNELRVELKEASGEQRRLVVTFRVYDDGVGFRYELPEQPGLADVEIMDEETEFVLAGDHQAWWIPAFEGNRYEYLYKTSPISFLNRSEDFNVVHTPLTMATNEGLYLSIHEAALTDYASMTLRSDGNTTLQCDLVPWSDGVKVRGTTPLRTPWRTIQIAESAGDLITSYLILNLNEPNQLEDVSWIKPGKYMGIWWAMHVDRFTWGSGYKHGATTETAKYYIDAAASHGFNRLLIEGWNVGWDGNWTANGDEFQFTTPHDDFDIEEVVAYAAERGVKLVGHHETAAGIFNYEQQLEDAFAFYKELGIDTVKTGYVTQGQHIKRRNEEGRLVGLEWHHGQWMVQHYRHVVETAAEYEIMLDVHEPIKPTGIRRTYPNMLTREGARGQEYNAWSGTSGNPPEHTVILPFTRLLAGPMDFTPGIFDILFDDPPPDDRVNTTLAKQLALYVVIYSPLQMAADLPENYVDQPALKFVQDVPVDWHETRVLHAQIGDVVTIVRRERDGDEWYLGSITDEEARVLEAPLDFLAAETAYVAEIYADAPDADWENNPLALEITEALVDRETVFQIDLAPGGGLAVRFRPATADEVESIPVYSP